MKLFIILLFLTTVFTLPLEINSYKTNFKINARSTREYEAYVNAVEHYENIVDVVLSSESEEFLIEFSHIPRTSLNKALKIQANALGIHNLSYPQMMKMPAIIGKHIHEMNSMIYRSIETTVNSYWESVWEDNQPSLSSFNGIFAQNLIDQIDKYDLLGKIKHDVIAYKSSSSFWMKQWMMDLFSSSVIFDDDDIELDFLRNHLSNIKTGLLLELHVQLMDFYTRMEVDAMDQPTDYYDYS